MGEISLRPPVAGYIIKFMKLDPRARLTDPMDALTVDYLLELGNGKLRKLLLWVLAGEHLAAANAHRGYVGRPSALGGCARKLLYKKIWAQVTNPIPPSRINNFFVGNIIEIAMSIIARAAVSKWQPTWKFVDDIPEMALDFKSWGYSGIKVRGTCDDILITDEVVNIIDWKSMSAHSFWKYKKSGLNDYTDIWGYLTQLPFYQAIYRDYIRKELGCNKPIVRSIVGLNKEIGWPWTWFDLDDVKAKERVKEGLEKLKKLKKYKTGAEGQNGKIQKIPERGFFSRLPSVPELYRSKQTGKKILDIRCVYCDYRDRCWMVDGGQKLVAISNQKVWIKNAV